MFKYLFSVVDCFSKFLWVYPIEDKTGETVGVITC